MRLRLLGCGVGSERLCCLFVTFLVGWVGLGGVGGGIACLLGSCGGLRVEGCLGFGAACDLCVCFGSRMCDQTASLSGAHVYI